jgi:hypothetical protein
MAIYNPSDLYGGEAFKIDTTPMMNFLVKRQAQEQAKEQALDKYYRDMIKTASDKNVRPQEAPAFYQAVQNYKNFYMQNSAALASGKNPALRMQAEQLAQVPYQIMSDSAPALATDTKIGQATLSNPDVKKRWTKKATDDYSASAQSIWAVDPETKQVVKNPAYKAFNTSLIEVAPKEMDVSGFYAKKFNEFGYKPSETIVGEKLRKGSQFVYEGTKEFSYDPQTLQQYGTAMKNSYDNDNDLQYNFLNGKTFDQMKSGDVNGFNDLNAIHKNVFKTNIQDDRDLFAATAIKTMAQTRTEPFKRIDEDAKMRVQAETSKQNAAAIAKAVANAKGQGEKIDVNTLPTALETFSDMVVNQKEGISVRSNKWVDKNGNLFTGTIKVEKGKLPTQVIKKIPNNQFVDEAEVQVKNGVPVIIQTEEGSVDRNTLLPDAIQDAKNKKQLNKTSFVPSMSGKVGQDLATNQSNDKLNLSI